MSKILLQACRPVIVYGDSWPEVESLRASWLSSGILSGKNTPLLSCHDVGTLRELLLVWPLSGVVLCLRPHERVFLLTELATELIGHPLVITIRDTVYLLDHWVIHLLYGEVPVLGVESAFSIAKTGGLDKHEAVYMLAIQPCLSEAFYVHQSALRQWQEKTRGLEETEFLFWMNEQLLERYMQMYLNLKPALIQVALIVSRHNASLLLLSRLYDIAHKTLCGRYRELLRAMSLKIHAISRQRGLQLRKELQIPYKE
ncbi:hypothetical protein AB5Q65_004851 [Salmonella enterica]